MLPCSPPNPSLGSTSRLTDFTTPYLYPEANPEKFNSRFRNKMFYAGVSLGPASPQLPLCRSQEPYHTVVKESPVMR